MGTEEISCHRAGGHHERFRPVDQSGEYEIDGCDLIDDRTEDSFHRIHLVDVGQSKTTERSQHENADASAEIAAIDRHAELEQNCRPDGAMVRGDVRLGLIGEPGEATEDALGHEEDRGKEY